MTPPLLTVALCTRNPRAAFLGETLAALRQQTLPVSSWELVVVDNASNPPLAVDLSWHPAARLVVEPVVGIARARAAAARAASAEIVVFVDDDNVLASGYLSAALRHLQAQPELGCFGGSLVPRFEQEPPAWTKPFWDYLAVKPLAADRVLSGTFDYPALPPTAGMVVRRTVLTQYAAVFASDPVRQRYLHSRCEDLDIGMLTAEAGLSVARFADMQLDHLMPASRLSENNLLRLWRDSLFSTPILEACHGRPAPAGKSLYSRIKHLARCWRLPRRERRFALAEVFARHAGGRIARRIPQRSL